MGTDALVIAFHSVLVMFGIDCIQQMQCSVCSMFLGQSNPGVMPVGGICSHWPPFSRMQVSQPVRQTEKQRHDFECFAIGISDHIGISKPNIETKLYILLTT